MASLDETGSGEFVQEREWTCSQHDYPHRHECDCCNCDLEWDCDECSNSEWLPVYNEDGTPKMRELSMTEAFFRRGLEDHVRRRTGFLFEGRLWHA